MAISTTMTTQFKQDILSGIHCFNQSRTPTGDTTNSAFTIANVSALTGLAVGMAVSGSGITAGSVIASIDSSTQITLSKAASATASGVALTCTGDTFKIALYTSSATLDATTTAYSATNEISGTGYTAGGTTLSNNVSPTTSGTTAFITWSSNPSWTSATFTANGALIYNSSRRGPVANAAVSTHAFGGDQSVSSGTFTAVLPTANSSSAIVRIS